jgi:murein L,D-transpeptidase YafK
MKLKTKTILFIWFGLIAGLYGSVLFAQDDSASFRNAQFASSRVAESWKKYNDTLAKEFRKKNIAYPPKDIYLRAFKSQNEMELWANNGDGTEYKLIKTYHVCAISGSLGPKRIQGDRQVPEGYYFIDDFNNASDFYLSLQLNYPNYSDQLLGSQKTGGDIYIHGGCVTIGCLPMTNPGIQEIYTVCLNARLNGQEFIPVHVFPTRLNKNGIAYLNREFANDAVKQQFWAELKTGYDYFEKYHKILPVMYTPEGKYAD